MHGTKNVKFEGLPFTPEVLEYDVNVIYIYFNIFKIVTYFWHLQLLFL